MFDIIRYYTIFNTLNLTLNGVDAHGVDDAVHVVNEGYLEERQECGGAGALCLDEEASDKGDDCEDHEDERHDEHGEEDVAVALAGNGCEGVEEGIGERKVHV
tara:strand:+ start:522 stop:830 length:309 start_codon:yes stop_codon:yes gene_type:complete